MTSKEEPSTTRDSRYDILFEPVAIGPVTAKNRFYQVPHATGTGCAMPNTRAGIRAVKAEGGWAVVCTGYCSIHPTSDDRHYPFSSLWNDADVRAQAIMVDSVHAHDALGRRRAVAWRRRGRQQGDTRGAAVSFRYRRAGLDHASGPASNDGQVRHRPASLVAARRCEEGALGGIRHRLRLCGHGIPASSSFCCHATTSGPTAMAAPSRTVHACCAR